MNIILFEPDEPTDAIAIDDPRAVHLIQVLRIQVGTPFFVGKVNGPRGKASLTAIDADRIRFAVEWEQQVDDLPPVYLMVGLPRPQTARKILQEVTALGVTSIHFFHSARGEPGYARSTLWSSGEWQRHLRLGAEQAFSTRLPTVYHHDSLPGAILCQPKQGTRIALDVYEAPAQLSATTPMQIPVSLAIGSERGWEGSERVTLRTAGFCLQHMGTRVLRTETACVAALSRVLDALG